MPLETGMNLEDVSPILALIIKSFVQHFHNFNEVIPDGFYALTPNRHQDAA